MSVRNSMYWWVADRETKRYASCGRLGASRRSQRGYADDFKKDFIVFNINKVKPVTGYRLYIWTEVDKGRRCCEIEEFRREWKTVKKTARGKEYIRQGREHKASWIRTKNRFEKWLKTGDNGRPPRLAKSHATIADFWIRWRTQEACAVALCMSLHPRLGRETAPLKVMKKKGGCRALMSRVLRNVMSFL